MEEYTMAIDWKTQDYKESTSHFFKLIYRFKAIPVENNPSFFFAHV